MSDHFPSFKAVLPFEAWQYTTDERLPPKFICEMIDEGKIVPCGDNGLHIHDDGFECHVVLNSYIVRFKSGKAGMISVADMAADAEIMQ